MPWNEAAVNWMQAAAEHGFGAMLRPRFTTAHLACAARARFQSRQNVSWQFDLGDEPGAANELFMQIGNERWFRCAPQGQTEFDMRDTRVNITARCGQRFLAQVTVDLEIRPPELGLLLARIDTQRRYAEVEIYADEAIAVTARLGLHELRAFSRSEIVVPLAQYPQTLEVIALGVAGTFKRKSLVLPTIALAANGFDRALDQALRR